MVKCVRLVVTHHQVDSRRLTLQRASDNRWDQHFARRGEAASHPPVHTTSDIPPDTFSAFVFLFQCDSDLCRIIVSHTPKLIPTLRQRTRQPEGRGHRLEVEAELVHRGHQGPHRTAGAATLPGEAHGSHHRRDRQQPRQQRPLRNRSRRGLAMPGPRCTFPAGTLSLLPRVVTRSRQ